MLGRINGKLERSPGTVVDGTTPNYVATYHLHVLWSCVFIYECIINQERLLILHVCLSYNRLRKSVLYACVIAVCGVHNATLYGMALTIPAFRLRKKQVSDLPDSLKHDNSLSGSTLQWRHNERDGVWNHQPHDCSLILLFQAQMKENMKAPYHWPLWGEFTGSRWIPRTKGRLRGKFFHLMTSSWI